MKGMWLFAVSLFLVVLIVPGAYAESGTLTSVEYPDRDQIKVKLLPQKGAPQARAHIEVTFKRTHALVQLHYWDMKPAILFGGDITTYVLWAITRDGEVENLGEVLGGHGSDTLKFQTDKKDFAVIMTAEPYYLVRRPSAMVMFASGHPKQKNAPSTIFSFDGFARAAAHENESIADLKWDSKTPLLLLQARETYGLAGRHQAATYAGRLYSDAAAQLKKAESQYKAHGGGNKLKDMARETVQLSAEAIDVSVRKIAAIELLAIIEERQARMDALEARSEAAEMMVALLAENKAELEAELSRERSMLNAALGKIADIRLSAAGAILTLSDILFQVDKADLKPEAKLTLAKLAGVMLAVPDCDALITGYTDSTGEENFNMDLSAKRAGAVLEFLASEGVSEARMEALGLGPQNPIADNSSAEGRKQNRRVEILFSM